MSDIFIFIVCLIFSCGMAAYSGFGLYSAFKKGVIPDRKISFSDDDFDIKRDKFGFFIALISMALIFFVSLFGLGASVLGLFRSILLVL